MTPLWLALLALVLAGPVPTLMARARRMHHTPVASMIAWQAVALAAVLAALGAGLSLATDRAWGREPGLVAYVVAGSAVGVTVLVAVRLLVSGHRVGTSLRELRRRHRAEIDLLASPRGSLRVVDHPVPVAYCLPAVRRPRVVISQATLDGLTEDELEAVLAHERAHLAMRHDLVLEAFTVLHRAFPRWVSSSAALREVSLLVEILADRVAVRRAGASALGGALLAVAQGRGPVGAMSANGGHDLVARVQVLADRRDRRLQAAVLVLFSWSVLVLPTALVVAPWLRGLSG